MSNTCNQAVMHGVIMCYYAGNVSIFVISVNNTASEFVL
jgi:hypothetical protein